MSLLPKAQAAIVVDGRPTRVMYDWMRSVDTTGVPAAPVTPQPQPQPDGSYTARWSVQRVQTGNNAFLFQLRGDVILPNVWSFYGRGAGDRAFVALSDGFTVGEGIAKSVTDGVTEFALDELPDSGVGAALVKITRDDFGRVEGTEAATTDDLDEGGNLYFTEERAIGAISAGPRGHIYYDASIDQMTTISAVDTPVKAAVATSIGPLAVDFDEPQNNRIRYTGEAALTVLAMATFSLSSTTAAETFTAYIAKNGAVIGQSKCRVMTNTAGNSRAGTCMCFVELAENDYLEFWLENNSSTDSIRVDELSIVCKL